MPHAAKALLLLCALCPAFAQKPEQPAKTRRTDLNLLGQTDVDAGESRRNENIQFNLVDNNALKELNVRLGTTATIIDEFRPSRSYFGSEFGNAPTPVLHLPAAGRSPMHGNGYFSHLNSVFSARSFFQAGDVKPARENDYGLQLGAPLWRGSHLFLGGSQQKLRGSVNGNVLVPRSDERTPLATDPAVRSIIERYLAAYPTELPNRTDVNERALNTNAPQVIDNDNAEARLDQQIATNDRLAIRYVFLSQTVDAFQLVKGQNPDTRTLAHTARATWSRRWSAATSTDFSAGFDRVHSLLVPEPNAVGPMISISGLQTLGPLATIPIDRVQNLFRYAGDAMSVRGNHTWTAGFGVLRRQLNGVETDVHRGFFSFTPDFGRDAITNFRMGIPTQHLRSIGDVHRGFRNWDLQFHAGDRWRATKNLTLTLGLRYNPVTTPVEVNRLNTIPYPCDCNNLAPQFGLAWRLPRWWGIVRSGYGLHFGEIFPVTFQQVRLSPPGNYKIVVPHPSLTDPLAPYYAGGDPNIVPTTYLLDDNLRTPYSHQYNFSWEPVLPGDWKLQLGYVGSRSHKLLIMWYENRARLVDGMEPTTGNINLRRQNPHFAEIRRVLNGSRGYFDAARVSLVLPRWRGLSIDAAYWFSKAIDLGSSYTNTAYDEDSRLSRSQTENLTHEDMKGPSPFDQPHAFLWRAAYEIPKASGWPRRVRGAMGGWTISAVTLLKKGTPFTVASGSDAPGFGNVDGNGGDRPNLLDPAVLGRTIGDPDTSRDLLPRSAFAYIRPEEQRGNLGRNTFRKGGIANVNAAISRTWPLRGDKQILFGAESINFFNTPQFAPPGFEMTSGNFGQITNTLNDGRTFRFLLRFGF
ncbi:MAG TPA: TonB-dependent receptor [Bryobacteraceae bacterium]|nr:TonB-dependent receptor [Bryobacteraceae bacterium]